MRDHRHSNRGPLRLAAAVLAVGMTAVASQPLAAGAPGPATAPEGLPTPAERCEYRCTPGYRETIEFIGELTRISPSLAMSYFGETSEGYPLAVVAASGDRLFTPEKARASGKPVVLIFSGIHAGEIDGKDASLALLRDMALGGHSDVLDSMVLLVVPIYNIDGHERVGPNNRLAQDGPVEGMGRRTNGRGLDLNRDFLKMETPETAALVGRLFNDWRPHLVLDCHVTDGMDFQYDMTYFGGDGPNAPDPLLAYVRRINGAILKGLTGTGHPAGEFWSLDDKLDPAKGMTAWSPTPRFSTAYFQSQARVSLLAETHAHKPFRTRVMATLEMIRAILREVVRDPRALVEAVSESEAEISRRAGSGFKFALESEPAGDGEPVDYLGWEPEVRRSEVTGETRILWSRKPVTWKVPHHKRRIPTKQVTVPGGYLLSRAYGHIARKAHLHGLRVERLLEDEELEVRSYRITGMKWSDRSFQGHHTVTATAEHFDERRRFPSGTFWIPLDQPGASLAVWMLEPESPDGLLHWNYFDNVMERKMIVERHMLEELAAEALRDAGVRKAYEEALAADPELASDPSARLWWFYERSPYFDDGVGLFPVHRIEKRLSARTGKWSPS